MAVDDNPDALENLVRLINGCMGLNLLHADIYPENAIKLILDKKIEPDLLFLDIKMPVLTGLEFTEQAKVPLVIYTTAYREYWEEALDHEATVHYLLKPIFEDKFNKAVAKARAILELNHKTAIVLPPPEELFIPGNGKFGREQIPTKEIVYAIANGNYTDIYLTDKKITTYLTLKAVAEQLVRPWFARVQKSNFVNVSKVIRVDANNVYLNYKGKEIILGIGDTYKLGLAGLFKR
jgi:two-component system LytT family response regulator